MSRYVFAAAMLLMFSTTVKAAQLGVGTPVTTDRFYENAVVRQVFADGRVELYIQDGSRQGQLITYAARYTTTELFEPITCFSPLFGGMIGLLVDGIDIHPGGGGADGEICKNDRVA